MCRLGGRASAPDHSSLSLVRLAACRGSGPGDLLAAPAAPCPAPPMLPVQTGTRQWGGALPAWLLLCARPKAWATLTSDPGLASKLPAVWLEVDDDFGPGSNSRGLRDFKYPRAETHGKGEARHTHGCWQIPHRQAPHRQHAERAAGVLLPTWPSPQATEPLSAALAAACGRWAHTEQAQGDRRAPLGNSWS